MENKKDFRIFAFGDPHLSFSQEKPMDIFGAKWKDHDSKIRSACLSEIKEDDYIIVAGDISWALKIEDAMPDLNWVDSLPRKKIIIKGNHDLWWHGITKLNKLYENTYFMQYDHFMITDELAICGTRGWLLPGEDGYKEADGKITKREVMRLKMSLEGAVKEGAKNIICAMHFPPAINPNKDNEFTKIIAEYPVSQLVYGHLHGSNSYNKGIKGNHNNTIYNLVSIDYLDFKPLLIYDSAM